MKDRENAGLPGTKYAAIRGYLAVLWMLVLLSGQLSAAEQVVAVQTSSTNPSVGEVVQATVTYTTANPDDPTLTGIGLRLHWNSQLLDFQQLTNILSTSLVAQGQSQPDTANYDNDPNTDTFIHLAWADITSNWPNLGASPSTLFVAEYLTPAAVVGSSPLNLSVSSTATGYSLADTPATVAVDCTGSFIEIQSRTFRSGENISCISTGNLTLGPDVEQQASSNLQVTANTGITINGPLHIKAGATFTAIHGGP